MSNSLDQYGIFSFCYILVFRVNFLAFFSLSHNYLFYFPGLFEDGNFKSKFYTF